MVVFYDFLNDTELSDWTFTAIATGTAPTVVADADGGQVVINHTGTTDNDGVAANYDSEFFKFTPNREYLWAARVTFNQATQNDWAMGMWITDTSPVDAATDPSDGVWFRKDDGDTNIDVEVIKDNVDTNSVSTASAHVYAIRVETKATVRENKIEFLIDGAVVASFSNTANLVDDEEMTLGFGIINGDASLSSMTVDWVLFNCNRA
jgi:hypothetical protein